jgi:hypothetical protein
MPEGEHRPDSDRIGARDCRRSHKLEKEKPKTKQDGEILLIKQ